MTEFKVVGLQDLLAVRRKLLAIGDAGLGKPMARQLRKTVEPLKQAVRAEAAAVSPGDYKAVLPKSLRFRQRMNTSRLTALITIRIFGEARKNRRDVPAINLGRLRHPLFGNRNFWYAQRVRAGFVDRPFDRHTPEVVKAMGEVIDDLADQITR